MLQPRWRRPGKDVVYPDKTRFNSRHSCEDGGTHTVLLRPHISGCHKLYEQIRRPPPKPFQSTRCSGARRISVVTHVIVVTILHADPTPLNIQRDTMLQPRRRRLSEDAYTLVKQGSITVTIAKMLALTLFSLSFKYRQDRQCHRPTDKSTTS